MDGWLSVSDLARARSVSKQAISKRMAAFAGKVPSQRKGRELLIQVDAFDRAVGDDTDPAQDLRNRNAAPGRTAAAAPTLGFEGGASEPRPQQNQDDLAAKVYSTQRARRESFDADLSKLKLERESGRWIEAAKAEAAWGKELSGFIAETESFIVNRLAREMAEEHGLDFKTLAVVFRDKFRAFRRQEAVRASPQDNQTQNGIHD